MDGDGLTARGVQGAGGAGRGGAREGAADPHDLLLARPRLDAAGHHLRRLVRPPHAASSGAWSAPRVAPARAPAWLRIRRCRPTRFDTSVRVGAFDLVATAAAVEAAKSGRKLTLTERLRLMIAEDDDQF